MTSSCRVLPNQYGKHYEANASAPLESRLVAADRYIDLTYGDFIQRQPDGYKNRPGTPVREPYFPLQLEYEWLERIADYILADDHAKGLMIIRDPVDTPRKQDVWIEPGEGATEYIRSKQAVADAVPYVLENFGRLKADAYANTDFSVIEFLTDFEAAVNRGDTESLTDIASTLTRKQVSEEGGPGTKICVICDLPFVDHSAVKNAKVCGKRCAKVRRKLHMRVSRFGTTELEGERNRQHLEYPFYSPEEMKILETRSERSYGDTTKLSRMAAAKERKQKHGVKHTVTLVGEAKFGVYTWRSNRNAHQFAKWGRDIRWGPIESYNVKERPLTEKFTESRGLSTRLCPWLDTCHISA